MFTVLFYSNNDENNKNCFKLSNHQTLNDVHEYVEYISFEHERSMKYDDYGFIVLYNGVVIFDNGSFGSEIYDTSIEVYSEVPNIEPLISESRLEGIKRYHNFKKHINNFFVQENRLLLEEKKKILKIEHDNTEQEKEKQLLKKLMAKYPEVGK